MRLPPRGVATSDFRPLRTIPNCCLPQEYRPCLSPIVADHPLRPATRRSLGKPLPHQQADRTQTLPKPPEFLCIVLQRYTYGTLFNLSAGYFPVWCRLSTHYSPVRHDQKTENRLSDNRLFPDLNGLVYLFRQFFIFISQFYQQFSINIIYI